MLVAVASYSCLRECLQHHWASLFRSTDTIETVAWQLQRLCCYKESKKKVYRKLSLIAHPDKQAKNPTDLPADFQRVLNAFKSTNFLQVTEEMIAEGNTEG